MRLSTKNLPGQKFGKLVVLKFSHRNNKRKYFLCKCDCGKEIYTRVDGLRGGDYTSCGECQERELIGSTFNRLIIQKFVGRNKRHATLFLCKCNCSNEIIVRGADLIRKHTTSCGRCQEHELIGKRFGKLTVRKLMGKHILKGDRRIKHNANYFECLCDCGNIVNVRTDVLTMNRATRCIDCANKEREIGVGKNEKVLLDAEEIKRNISIQRQKTFVPLPYVVDGYCKEKNLIFEVNEKYHDKHIAYDRKRREQLEQLTGCEFVIIHDRTH